MREIFTSPDDDNENEFSGRISFDNDSYSTDDFFSEDKKFQSGDKFTPQDFEDFSSGRNDTDFNVDIKNDFTGNFYQPSDFNNNKTDYELPHESTADEYSDEKSYLPKIKKESAKGAKKIIIAAPICILLVLILGLFFFAYSLCGKTDYQPDTHKKNEYISESELNSSSKVKNILVISTDERETQANFRSDSMILVSVDSKTKNIKLTSFLRDSYVYIPAKGFSTKLNAACSYGGAQMVIDTIEYNYKVHIDNYVMINFQIFKDIINDLGGVKLTITEEEAACIRRESGLECKSGTHTYRGRLALWYARIRHLDSDFKRTERQRKVFQAVLSKMKKSSPSTLLKMFNNVLPRIQTDMSASDLFLAGFKALPTLGNDLEEMQIPVKGTWSNATINGQAVLKMDIDENAQLLKEFIYGDK